MNKKCIGCGIELQDNDIVKIKTNNTAKPNKDWINFVKTSQARNKIKAYLVKNSIISIRNKDAYLIEVYDD
mgnify:CR=1 FL=1